MEKTEVLRVKLDSLEEKIVSRKFLAKAIRDVMHDKPEKYIKRLRETGKIRFVFQNYYCILSENERKLNRLNYAATELVFGVMNRSNVRWYISLEKGLELNNILHQAYKKINIINTKISGERNILGTMFEFRKTKPRYVNSYRQNRTKNRITQNIGSKEKIFLDFVYFKKKVPIELKKTVDKRKTISIMSSYPEKFRRKIKTLLAGK